MDRHDHIDVVLSHQERIGRQGTSRSFVPRRPKQEHRFAAFGRRFLMTAFVDVIVVGDETDRKRETWSCSYPLVEGREPNNDKHQTPRSLIVLL